jgi:hypothetical protein
MSATAVIRNHPQLPPDVLITSRSTCWLVGSTGPIGEEGAGLSPVQNVAHVTSFTVYVDGKAGIGSKKSLLPLGVTAVSAMGIGVEQFADGKTIGGL